MTKFKLNREQVKCLETILFWNRNKEFYHFDKEQVSMSQQSIIHWLDKAEELEIPLGVINVVRYEMKEDPHQDILHILDKYEVKRSY